MKLSSKKFSYNTNQEVNQMVTGQSVQAHRLIYIIQHFKQHSGVAGWLSGDGTFGIDGSLVQASLCP